MRALVTGGAGFIGSNLVDALLDRGDEVAVADDLSTGRIENLDGARRRGIAFHECDITDAERVLTVFSGTRPDIVFHLAAQIDVRKSIEDPAWDAGINVAIAESGGVMTLSVVLPDDAVNLVLGALSGDLEARRLARACDGLVDRLQRAVSVCTSFQMASGAPLKR